MTLLQVKRKIASVWPEKFKNRKIILLYHSIGNTSWGMPTQCFYDQISWLTDHYEVLSLTDLLKSKSSNLIQVALTFDDGYQTLYDQVAPLCATKKIRPMVYLNTGWIGEDEHHRKASVAELGHYPKEWFLTWQEVRDLKNRGWEVGSHGVNHYNFARMDRDVTLQELTLSKQHIETHLNTNCLHFSYPWGRYSARVKEVVKTVGYHYAVSVVHKNIGRYSDLFALPRMNIANEYSLDDFKQIVQGKWDYLGLIHKLKGL